MTKRLTIEVTFVPRSEGGRIHEVDLEPGMYRPHLVVVTDGKDGEYLGVTFVSPVGVVPFSRTVRAEVELAYHPRVDYAALAPGVGFVVREGGRTVGHGTVR